MTSMNDIIYLCSDDDEEDGDKLVKHTDSFADEKPKRNNGYRKSDSPNFTVEEEDDDDCVVLDSDPYKETEKETTFDTDDEILFVGQKGEIACRDFPHPRHACAKYPFKSTSHDKYCDMCHCYVCDIPAPCPYWCFGSSSVDHCHANDKEQTWKNQREIIRIGKSLPPTQSLLSPQNPWYPLVNQFGVRASSASAMVASLPNSYIRPGYRPQQNPGVQPRGHQLVQQNRSGGSYNGNPIPQVLSSKSFTWTQRPSGGPNLVGNGVHNVSQGSQYTGYAPPPTALQGNSQESVTGYDSTVPSSHTDMYGRQISRNARSGSRQFSRNTRSGNPQTSAVISQFLDPPFSQQQQVGNSNNKVLSEIEEWLMDSSIPTDTVCPLSGQVDSTTFPFDLETFFE